MLQWSPVGYIISHLRSSTRLKLLAIAVYTIFDLSVQRHCRLWASRSLIRLHQRSGHQCMKPAQTEPLQDITYLDQNTPAVGQSKHHQANIAIGHCPFFNNSVCSQFYRRLATEYVGPCCTGMPLMLLSTAAATTCAMLKLKLNS